MLILNITLYDLNIESYWVFLGGLFWFVVVFVFGSVDSVDRGGELGEQHRDSKLNDLRLVIRINTTISRAFLYS